MFIMHLLSLYDINSLEKYAGSLKLSRALEPPIRVWLRHELKPFYMVGLRTFSHQKNTWS